MTRPWLLGGAYAPTHDLNRMASEGDVSRARDRFLQHRFRNLDHLLRGRYAWMNAYLRPDMAIYEVGAGAGFSALYLSPPAILTDTVDNPWIARRLDATAMDLPDASVDALIASHTLHHFYSPHRFFAECLRVLRPGGVVLIQEVNTALMLRALLRLMRHEGWSYDVDVFDPNAVVNQPDDPWSANCAVPEMLFRDPGRFEAAFPGLAVERNALCECLVFPASGGVIAKTRVPELPGWLLGALDSLDRLLIGLAPGVFAMGRSIALRKVAG